MNNSKHLVPAIGLSLAIMAASVTAETTTTELAGLDLSGMTSGWKSAIADREVGDGAALTVAGEAHDSGIGTHADSVWKLNLEGRGIEFRSKVGVQDGSPGRVEFIVKGDGKELARSGPITGGDPAKPLYADLAGIRSLELIVDALGDTTSDHADWLDPVIVHNGAHLPAAIPKPPEPALEPDLPGEPPNAAAKVDWNPSTGSLSLFYDGKTLFNGHVLATGAVILESASKRKGQAVTQEITLRGNGIRLEASAAGSGECIPAETRGTAQKSFPLIRTSIGGPSISLRNNAIYDRTRDWILEAPSTSATRITPKTDTPEGRTFTLATGGDEIRLTFRPRYYQRHKHITHFRPWTYQVRKDSITGWSSWFAFLRDCSQKNCDELLAVWKDKRMADFGYKFIQLDDCFQNELGQGQDRPRYPGTNRDYPSRGPATWLDWRKDHYPAGIGGFAASCKDAGFEPGLWVGAHITDNDTITRHPDWFIRDPAGKPFVGPWISCAVDSTNKEALDTLVRPTFAGIRKAGIPYLKIDLLRHYLYDNLHHNEAYCKDRGVTPAQMFREYLTAARQELGKNAFILSCWGVLPEGAGLVDGCRVAGDGYGPVSMQQYNAWNGIVWRNDPDICDVYPKFKGVGAGNVTKFEATEVIEGDTVIRPALASIAGAMLMLGDKPDVYRDDRNLEGSKRSAPVLFSVPGQLYNFDERKSDALARVPRESIKSGAQPAPCDADQHGSICPWWLNEFNIQGVGQWAVLHRVSWGSSAPAATIPFADMGLESGEDYLVYEFWTHTFLGVKRGQLELPAAKDHELRSYALRKLESHPQIASTNRHLSQGGADLMEVKWTNGALSGRSKVVSGDRYELAIHVPQGYVLKSATIAGVPAQTQLEDELLRVSCLPSATQDLTWSISFTDAPPAKN